MTEFQCNSAPENRIAETFTGKTLLVTGGIGFIGKVFIEKLLRTSPLVNKIFVLIRTKKSTNPQTRLREAFKSPLFDLLKTTRGEEILRKVIPIPGDIFELSLGLSEENKKLLIDEVDLIFHIAAVVRFDEPFKTSVLLNTRGTKLMLDFAKECKKLLMFAHVSTAYCHPEEKVLYEKPYGTPVDPHNIIELAKLLDQDTAQAASKKLKGDCPNTYTFTKALAEAFVNEEMNNLPVIILRPSVVVPIWKDPLPGWTDNLNGPTGLLVACGKGILRSMFCNPTGYADFISVDVVANAFMIATYDYLTYKKRRIYNLASSSEIQITWNEIIKTGKKLVTTKMPLNWAVWYPGGSMKTSRLYNKLCIILYHYVLALILDFLISLSGNKPVLWKVQQRISKGFELFEYYTTNQWSFDNTNIRILRTMLNDTEKKIYPIDPEGLDIEQYFLNSMHATRLYVLKESDESLPTAKRHMTMLRVLDRLFRIVKLVGVGYVLFKYVVNPVLETVFGGN